MPSMVSLETHVPTPVKRSTKPVGFAPSLLDEVVLGFSHQPIPVLCSPNFILADRISYFQIRTSYLVTLPLHPIWNMLRIFWKP